MKGGCPVFLGLCPSAGRAHSPSPFWARANAMSRTEWKVEYAKSGRAGCKYASCKRKIGAGELRVGLTQRPDGKKQLCR